MKLRTKIFLWIITVVCGLVFGLYLALFHLGLMEYIVNRELSHRVTGNLPVTVIIGDISGDYLSNLSIDNIFVFYDDTLESFNLAYVPRIKLEYSLAELWRGNLILEKFEIDSAHINFKKSEHKGWLIPRGKEDSENDFSLIDFEIKQIALNDLRIKLNRIDDTLIFKNINLMARIQSRENTYSAIVDSFNFNSSDDRYNMSSSGGKFTLSGSEFLFEELYITTDSSSAEISGHISTGDEFVFRLNIDADNINLPELSSYVNTQLKGNIATDGGLVFQDNLFNFDLNISGDFMDRNFDSLYVKCEYQNRFFSFDTIDGYIFNGCKIGGFGELDLGVKPGTYYYEGDVEHFDLNNIVFNTFVSDLSGYLVLNGFGFKSEEMELTCEIDFDESWFDEYHAHAIDGEIIVTRDSLIITDTAVVSYHENDFKITGALAYKEDLQLGVLSEFRDLSKFDGQTFIERMGGRGTMELTACGNLKNPDVVGQVLSDSLWLYDIFSRDANINFEIDRFLFDREGQVDITLLDGFGYNLDFDSIYSEISLDTQFTFIDSFRFKNSFMSGISNGTLDYYSIPQKLILNNLYTDVMGLPIINDDVIVIDIDSAGYDIIQGRVKRDQGFLDALGRINYDETLSPNVSGEKIEINPWVRLYDEGYNIEGSISGKADISGNFLSPIFTFLGKLDSLSYQNLYLGDVSVHMKYLDQYLNIDSVAVRSDEGLYRVHGKFPIDLAFTIIENRFPDIEQDIYISANDKRLDLVALLMDDVDDFIGKFNADFTITGTPQKPKLDGTISVKDGKLKLFDLINPLDSVQIDMSMTDNRIKLNNLFATSKSDKWKNKLGILNGAGNIIINNIDEYNYNLNLFAADFPINYELGDAQALLNANLHIIGATPPTVYGDVDILSMAYRENFAAEDEGWMIMTALESEDSWNYNINVRFPSNLWIKNDDIDAEFSGNINIIRDAGIYKFVGELEILRGKGYWVDRTFRITPGSMIYYEDIDYPNPRLDIYATTKVRTSVMNNVTHEPEFSNVDLCVHVTGTLDEPIIMACDESQFSTEDILTMIFMNYAPSDSANASTEALVGDRLTAGLSGILSSSLGKIGSRTLGVETFEIDPVYGDKFDPMGTRVTLGLYTLPNLYIYGRSDIAGQSGRELGFEYRLRRFLLMEGRVDNDNLYRLFFNFYWDY